MRHQSLLVLSGAAALSAVALHAAPISWTPPANTGGKADLIAGNVAIALNGGTASPTITGGGAGGDTDYNFVGAHFANLAPHTLIADLGGPTPQARITDSVYNPEAITSSGDADFDALVSSVTDSYGSPAGISLGTLTLNGLLDGGAYTIQVFFNDQRDPSDARIMRYGDGEGNTIDLMGGDPTAGVQGGHYGQHATGTFTALGTTQDLTMESIGFGNIHFTAIVVTGPPLANVPPEFEFFTYIFEVEDGAATETPVGSVFADDPDDGPEAVSYTITAGNTDDAFEIDSATGEITVLGTIDLTTLDTYELTIEASDGSHSELATVYIDVTPPPAPPVNVTAAGSSIGETNWVANGFGSLGYLFANTDDNDLEAGAFKRGGAIYIDSEIPGEDQSIMFSSLALSNSLWSTHGVVPGTALTAALNADLENPDGGTFKVGNLQTHGLADDGFTDSFTLTFDDAMPDGCRIGILVGAKEVQGLEGAIGGTTGNLRDIPHQLRVDSVTAFTTQTALTGTPEWITEAPTDPTTGLPRADWYFFDLNGIQAGASVTIGATRVYSGISHKFNPVNGVVIASLGTPAPAPVITGVSRTGTILTINFTGEPGITDWKVMAGTDLLSFPTDETPDALPEGPDGTYEARVDLTGAPDAYYLRVER